MSNRADLRRRRFGTVFLIVAAGLLVLGQTVFDSRLRGLEFLIYWLFCFIFTGLAMLMALLDARAVRRRVREQQRELIERTLQQAMAKRNEQGRGPEVKSP